MTDSANDAVKNPFSKIAVLGGGTMGSGIAQVCAMSGAEVVLRDIDEPAVERGMTTIQRFLDKGVERGKVDPGDRATTLERISTTTDLGEACAKADLVIEAVPEKLDLKRSVFQDVAAHASESAVLATNTSSLALSKVFEGLPNQARCIGTHFFNPVPIMALLEIVRPDACSDETLQRVRDFGAAIGKEPIVVRDVPGFATSRLGVCLGLEAIRMVESEVASPEDIDKALVLGYRHPMGPLRLTDLVGLDVRLAIADYLREELNSPAFEAPQLMRDMVAEGKLGQKSGQGFYEWSS
ncbi:MAG: 3-hydroxyacyl-CoA dehydrogenase family protein [Planctomycetota bacterium]